MRFEELQLMEDKKLYPPRFVVKVCGSAAAESSRAIFTFQGTIKTIVKEVILNKGKVLFHTISTLIGGCIMCLDTNQCTNIMLCALPR